MSFTGRSFEKAEIANDSMERAIASGATPASGRSTPSQTSSCDLSRADGFLFWEMREKIYPDRDVDTCPEVILQLRE
jgi:hypothetical protein